MSKLDLNVVAALRSYRTAKLIVWKIYCISYEVRKCVRTNRAKRRLSRSSQLTTLTNRTCRTYGSTNGSTRVRGYIACLMPRESFRATRLVCSVQERDEYEGIVGERHRRVALMDETRNAWFCTKRARDIHLAFPFIFFPST